MAKKTKSSITLAYDILKRKKIPMTAKELINTASKEFGTVLKGKTPDATLNANFINEIKRRNESKKEQRFVRVSRGKWGLVEYIGVHYEIKDM